jgi:hypothetical protein
VVSSSDPYPKEAWVILTGIGNLDANGPTLECLAIPGQGSLETLDIGELGIRKTLGPVLFAVLNDAHIHDVAVGEKLGDGLDGRIVGQVAKMGRERRLVGKLLGKVIAKRVVTLGRRVLASRFQHTHRGQHTPIVAGAVRARGHTTVGRGKRLGA